MSTIETAKAPQVAQQSSLLLDVKDLRVTFGTPDGDVTAVNDLNFNLRAGETLGIVGESGSGKSQTAFALMGLLAANGRIGGSATFHGKQILNLPERELNKLRAEQISMIFQDPMTSLNPYMRVGEQLMEVLMLHKALSKAEAFEESVKMLDAVKMPEARKRMKMYPHEFSGGMRQRVMIAMAIANDPDVIIADEPTTALDVTIQAQVLEVLRKAQRETGAAVIFITHDLGVIAGVADDIVVMYAGRPVEKADVDSIFDHPAMPYTMGLLGAVPRSDRERNSRLVPIPGSPMNLVNMPKGCPFAPRCPLATDICHTTEPAMEPVPDRPGQFVACHRTQEIVSKGLTFHDVYTVAEAAKSKFAGVPRDERKMVLDVKHMRKTFPLTAGGFLRRKIGEVKAVDDVTLDVREGETVALVGESGSGKSTTLMEIMAFKQPQDGEIEMFGTKLEHKMPREKRRELRSSVQYVFQDPMSSLDPRLPIYDILAEPMKVQHYSKEQIRERIGELMRLVELNPDQVDRFPTQFSGGQRQRIAIARALSVNPQLVLLDEPVSALDVSIQAGVINLLEDLQNKLGVAYLFVAHNLSVVRHISSRVAVMYLGRIVESGATEDVFEHPLHPYTQALISAVPVPDPKAERTRQRIVLEGEVPSPTETFEGCPFMGRCPLMPKLSAEQQARCRGERPALRPYDTSRPSGHQVACHFA